MREKEPSTRIVFVRHGSTDFPQDRIYCDDREDPALNAAGRAQADDAAALLGAMAIDRIIASPAARTRETAAAAGRISGAPLQTHEGLRERRFGVWDGLYFAAIEQHYPEDYAAWKRDQAAFTPAGGESIHELQTRVQACIGDLLRQFPGQRLAVVAHVGPIRVALCAAIGLPLAGYRQLTIDPGSLTCVAYGRRQNNLVFLNYRLRLGPI